MKVNPNVNVSFQDYGTNILLVMEGKHEQVERQHFSFINRGAVDPDAQIDFPIKTPERTIGLLWSTREKMQAYFRNRAYFLYGSGKDEAKRIGERESQAFFAENRERDRMRFGGQLDSYSTGTASAEKPDESGQEQWVSRGLSA